MDSVTRRVVLVITISEKCEHMKPIAIRNVLIIALLPLLLVSNQLPITIQPATDTITFTAVGDFGATNNTTAVLDTIASSGASFHLALGDLSYGVLKPESSWCDYVKSHVGSTFPFELIAGNHDSGQIAAEGNINNFVPCLPDRIGTISGTYGKEYYFDYPAAAPLARFILISPQINFVSGGAYSYASGSTHYNWVKNSIDNARSAGIPWVIVGMHKVCIGVAGHTCEVESALFNLLIQKKVDLILQAHNHNYQRSKQLALSSSCTSITGNSFNSSCVVDDGTDNLYTKDTGSVIVIAGMGGHELYNINTTDPDNGYFARLMAANTNPTHGIVRYTLSATQLSAEFVRASGGNFQDTFSINKSGPTPISTPTRTSTPTSNSTPTRTATPANSAIASDTFSRTVTDGWGNAETGGAYSGTSSADFDVNGNEGLISVPVAGQQRKATLSSINVQNVDMKIRVKADKLAAGAGHQISLLARQLATTGQYRARLELTPNGSVQLVGQKYLVSTNLTTNIGSVITVPGLTYAANQYIWLRVQVVGLNPTTIRIKTWADGQPEPASWQYTGTDSEAVLQSSGNMAILSRLNSTSTVAPVLFTYDDLSVTSP